MKIIKPIIYFITGLIFLFVLALIILFTFVNPNNYKSYITQTLSQKTKSQVVINGNIRWSIYPEVSFKLEDINITGNLDGNNLELKTNYLKLSISFFKSLKNLELSFDNIFVDNPVLNIYSEESVKFPSNSLVAHKKHKISIASQHKDLDNHFNDSSDSTFQSSNDSAARINIEKIVINNAVIKYFKGKRTYNLVEISTDILVDSESFANVIIVSAKPKRFEIFERPAQLDLHLKLNDNRKGNKNIVIQSLDLNFNVQDLKFNVISSLFSSNYVDGLLGINFNLTTTFQKFELPNIIRGLNGKFNIILNDTNINKLEKLANLAELIEVFENVFNQKDSISPGKHNKAREVLDLLSQNRLFKRRLKIRPIDDKKSEQRNIIDTESGTDIKSTGVIKQGSIHNNLLLINKVYTIEGQGKLNLNNNIMRYNITALRTGDSNNKDKTVIPLILYGNIRKPEIKLDIKRTIDNNRLFEKALKLLSGD